MASTLATASVMRLGSSSRAMIVVEKAARNSSPSGAIASPKRLPHAKTRRTLRGVAVGDAAQALAEGGCAEVHQQAEREIHQAQVGQHLLAVDRREPLDRL